MAISGSRVQPGDPVYPLRQVKPSGGRGTSIRFKPSTEIFY